MGHTLKQYEVCTKGRVKTGRIKDRICLWNPGLDPFHPQGAEKRSSVRLQFLFATRSTYVRLPIPKGSETRDLRSLNREGILCDLLIL